MMTDFKHIRELLAVAENPKATDHQRNTAKDLLCARAPIEMRAMLDRIDKMEAVAAAVSPALQEADRDTVNFNRLRTAIKALEARDDQH